MKTKQISRQFKLFAAGLALCLFAIAIERGAAQSGVLIPVSLTGDKNGQPNENVLSLATMSVDICVDNQFATARVVQIFENHTAETLEGKYLFALPKRGSISDFAVWDGDTRIPGVILEKRRAEAVYAEIKAAEVDPGLLQQTDETAENTGFSAKVFPIPPFGTKRVEMEYTETLPIENLQSRFVFPLKPASGATQTVKEFQLKFCIDSDYAVEPVNLDALNYPLEITKNSRHEFEAVYASQNVRLEHDFEFNYRVNAPENSLSFTTYRAPEKISVYDLRDPAQAAQNPDGYFEARAIFANRNEEKPPRRLILLLDTSLSMHGEKLARAVEAVEYFLHSLGERDEFNLVLFNNDTQIFSEKPVAANAQTVENAVQFVKNSALGGGTNLKKAVEKSVELTNGFSAGERQIVLISDANPTLETINAKTISAVFDRSQNPANPTKFFAFALGNDANADLLKDLTEKTNGYFDQARETEDISIALENFFQKIGQPTIENLGFNPADNPNFYQIYPSGRNSFAGSSFQFVGRYKQPKTETIQVSGKIGTEDLAFSRVVELPEFADERKHLPRVWARARVDALLREINLNGEREDYINEIIRLSQKYKFVTDYTSFLAAPRALLRPRLIQPGDPVIRVKTDDSIKAVFAVLPFGETLPLEFVKTEKIWETRFLAPAWMPDGVYACRLLLTDKNGNGYEEQKTFVVDSRAPKLKITLPAKQASAGDEILIEAAADSDTARIVAKLYGAQPVALVWSNADKTNVGRLRVPANLQPGKYQITVTAEDFAHNQSTVETTIEIFNR